jgi:hypothetical protein
MPRSRRVAASAVVRNFKDRGLLMAEGNWSLAEAFALFAENIKSRNAKPRQAQNQITVTRVLIV